MSHTEKINGYTKAEAKQLIDFVSAGKSEGKPLSYLFAAFGREHGRAKGSVRNYYYTLLKDRSDERVVELLGGTTLSVEKIRSFTAEETDEVLRSILQEKAKGMSVRRAIRNLTAGDEKQMLRLQNKYRNLVKKRPEYVRETAERLGLKEAVPMRAKTLLQRRVEEEIDSLCRRLTEPLEEENARLKAEIAKLKEMYCGE
jgi:LPS O-antigen subunit length determinant protein (WzzB/FepE family)